MEYGRLIDKVSVNADPPGDKLDLSVFPGVWVNSNPDTHGICRVEFALDDGELSCRIEAAGPDGRIDWGYANDIHTYADGPTGKNAWGFTARYDFGFVDVEMQGNLTKGLMVLATLNRFRDDSGRSNYFLREYYAMTHELFV